MNTAERKQAQRQAALEALRKVGKPATVAEIIEVMDPVPVKARCACVMHRDPTHKVVWDALQSLIDAGVVERREIRSGRNCMAHAYEVKP